MKAQSWKNSQNGAEEKEKKDDNYTILVIELAFDTI